MLSVRKLMPRYFSSLLIPDPNKFSSDVKSLINAGKKFNEPIKILQLSTNNEGIQKEYIEQVNDSMIEEIIFAEHKMFDVFDYEGSNHFLKKYIKDQSFNRILMVNSAMSKEILPQLSVCYDTQAITDVIDILDEKTFLRPIYAGNAIAKVSFKDSPAFIGIRNTNFDKAVKEEGETKYKVSSITANDYLSDFEPKVKVVDNIIKKSDRPELPQARVVISGGRGMKSAENFELLYKLADKIPKSAVGASRAAVDAGYVPNDLQIGQTGKIVAPDLYIAFGISGAIQHLAGIKDSKVIVAINKDDEAPIFQVADYSLSGDLFKILPELVDKIDKV